MIGPGRYHVYENGHLRTQRRISRCGDDPADVASQIAPVVVVDQQRLDFLVAGEPGDRPNVTVRRIEGMGNRSVSELVDGEANADPLPPPLHDTVDARTGDPTAFPCAVEVHEEGAIMGAPDIEPPGERACRRRRKRQRLTFGAALPKDRYGESIET